MTTSSTTSPITARDTARPAAATLDLIHAAMSGEEWDTDTLDTIRDLIEASGRRIADSGDVDTEPAPTPAAYYVQITHCDLARNPETGEWEPLPEGQHAPSIVVGPYATEDDAAAACNDDPQVDAHCCDTKNPLFVDDVVVIAAADVPADAVRWTPRPAEPDTAPQALTLDDVAVSTWVHRPATATDDDGEPEASYVVVQIDTTGEPDDMALRVYLNDAPIHTGAPAR